MNDHDLILFPNPASSEVFIGLNGFVNKAVELRLFDQVGRQLWQLELPNAQDELVQLNLNELGLTPGVYTVILQSEGLTIAKRLVFARKD